MFKNKKLLYILPVILLLLIFAISYNNRQNKPAISSNNEMTTNQSTIPISKDEYGCATSMGFSWCESLQKCINTANEECEVLDSGEVRIPDTTFYINMNYGFELDFPRTWDDYYDTQQDYPNYSHVSFSFMDGHRPFTIFQIIKYTTKQWDALPVNPYKKILHQSEKGVFVCDGCCDENGDFTGGGQFDEFQIERCKEVPEIIKSFKIID